MHTKLTSLPSQKKNKTLKPSDYQKAKEAARKAFATAKKKFFKQNK